MIDQDSIRDFDDMQCFTLHGPWVEEGNPVLDRKLFDRAYDLAEGLDDFFNQGKQINLDLYPRPCQNECFVDMEGVIIDDIGRFIITVEMDVVHWALSIKGHRSRAKESFDGESIPFFLMENLLYATKNIL